MLLSTWFFNSFSCLECSGLKYFLYNWFKLDKSIDLSHFHFLSFCVKFTLEMPIDFSSSYFNDFCKIFADLFHIFASSIFFLISSNVSYVLSLYVISESIWVEFSSHLVWVLCLETWPDMFHVTCERSSKLTSSICFLNQYLSKILCFLNSESHRNASQFEDSF